MLEKLLTRLKPVLGLHDEFVVTDSGRVSLAVDNDMEIEVSELDHQRVLMQSVVKKLDDNERAAEDSLRELLRRSTAVLRESRSVLTIDPVTHCVVLFSLANVDTLESNRAELWLEEFLNDLETLRKVASPAPAWEMPVRFLRP